MNDDDISLASAYLDGDVTPAERATVEASETLSAEVERLRRVRALLGSEDAAAISMRERHLAAALDAWDRLPDVERIGAVRDQTPDGVDAAAAAAASTVTAPPPTSLAARRATRGRGWMLAAAAGLVVVLAGGIVVNTIRSDDTDDSADSAAEAPVEVENEPVSEVDDVAREAGEEFATEAASEPAAEPAPAPEAEVEEAQDVADVPTDADLAADGAEADSTGGAAAEDEAASDPAVGGPEAAPPDDDVIGLETPLDLSDYARLALDENVTTADVVPTTGAPTDQEGVDEGVDVPQCPGIEIVVGPAAYQGVPVVIGIDLDSNEAVASNIVTCAQVARASLP